MCLNWSAGNWASMGSKIMGFFLWVMAFRSTSCCTTMNTFLMSWDKTTWTSVLHLGSLSDKQNPGSRRSFQSSRTKLTPEMSLTWNWPTLESNSGKFTCFLRILRFLHAPITLIVISCSPMKYFIFSRTKRSTCIIQILLSCVPFSFVFSWTADFLIWKDKKYQKPYFRRLSLNRECTW